MAANEEPCADNIVSDGPFWTDEAANERHKELPNKPTSQTAQKSHSLAVAKRLLFAPFLAVFVDYICQTMPDTGLNFVMMTQLNATSTDVGVMIALYPAGQVVGMPIVGAVSDQLGRRPAIFVAGAGSMLGAAMALAAESVALLQVTCFIWGLFGSSLVVANACILDVLQDEESRIKALAAMNGLVTAAIVLGPAAGAAFTLVDLKAPVVAVLFVAGAALLINLPLAHETKLATTVGTATPAVNRGQLWGDVMRSAAVSAVLSGSGLYSNSLFPVFLSDRFGWGASSVGGVLAAQTLIMTLVLALAVPALVGRLGAVGAQVLFGSLALAAGNLALCGLGTDPYALSGAPLLVFGGCTCTCT